MATWCIEYLFEYFLSHFSIHKLPKLGALSILVFYSSVQKNNCCFEDTTFVLIE